MVAGVHRAFHILELEAVLLDRVHPKEIRLSACGKDERVIGDDRAVRLHVARLEIDLGDFAHLEGDVLLTAEDRPQGIGDLRRDQPGNGDLV